MHFPDQCLSYPVTLVETSASKFPYCCPWVCSPSRNIKFSLISFPCGLNCCSNYITLFSKTVPLAVTLGSSHLHSSSHPEWNRKLSKTPLQKVGSRASALHGSKPNYIIYIERERDFRKMSWNSLWYHCLYTFDPRSHQQPFDFKFDFD